MSYQFKPGVTRIVESLLEASRAWTATLPDKTTYKGKSGATTWTHLVFNRERLVDAEGKPLKPWRWRQVGSETNNGGKVKDLAQAQKKIDRHMQWVKKSSKKEVYRRTGKPMHKEPCWEMGDYMAVEIVYDDESREPGKPKIYNKPKQLFWTVDTCWERDR